MKSKIILMGIALALLLSACATGTTQPTGASIQISDAWTRTVELNTDAMGGMNPTPDAMSSHAGGMSAAKANSASYMKITNGGAADKLMKAESDVAETVELHNVTMQDGVMQMRPVEFIEVPSNGSVELKPGGYHVMLLGVKQSLKAGDQVKIKLTFEKAGVQEITAPVRAQ